MSNLNRFSIFFTERFLGTFALKWLTKMPPHLPYAATLLCETLIPENKRFTINYKAM